MGSKSRCLVTISGNPSPEVLTSQMTYQQCFQTSLPQGQIFNAFDIHIADHSVLVLCAGLSKPKL